MLSTHLFPSGPSNRLSLERAREYDRISELLSSSVTNQALCGEFGVEARRAQFDENSYRQPVLTQKAMAPRAYRRGQIDVMTDDCRTRLLDLQDYALLDGSSSGSVTSSARKGP